MEQQIVDVCAVSDLPPGEVAVVTVPELGRIAVFNVEGNYYGIQDRCSHQQAWLSEGFLEESDCAIECPLHAASFSLLTGTPSAAPATEAVAVYAAFSSGDTVQLALPNVQPES